MSIFNLNIGQLSTANIKLTKLIFRKMRLQDQQDILQVVCRERVGSVGKEPEQVLQPGSQVCEFWKN